MANSPIDPSIAGLIHDCVYQDEGGWKLTANANDPDGGWTYAGCTKNTIVDHWGKDWNISAEEVQKDLPSNDMIYSTYIEEFITPLQLSIWSVECHAAMFSCAVNRGATNAIKAAQLALGINCDGIIGSTTKLLADKLELNKFLYQWTLQYIRLVRDNARAWHDFTKVSASTNVRPAVFRADSLEGWFNRVERYRA